MVDFCYWIIVDRVEVRPPQARAYLAFIDGKEYWIPASTVHDDRIDDNGDIEALWVEKWMIGKKGLEAYIEDD